MPRSGPEHIPSGSLWVRATGPLHFPAGTRFHMVTGVREHNGRIWMGSLHEPAVAVLTLWARSAMAQAAPSSATASYMRVEVAGQGPGMEAWSK